MTVVLLVAAFTLVFVLLYVQARANDRALHRYRAERMARLAAQIDQTGVVLRDLGETFQVATTGMYRFGLSWKVESR